MNKKLIKLTESDLHKIVKEAVQEILRKKPSYKYSNLAHLKKAKKLDDKYSGFLPDNTDYTYEEDDEYSNFLPNNTDYTYEELAMMDDGLDFIGL